MSDDGDDTIGQDQCWRKRRYRTYEYARDVAGHYMGTRESRPLRVYFCGICTGYHITHTPTLADRLNAENPKPTNVSSPSKTAKAEKPYNWEGYFKKKQEAAEASILKGLGRQA